MWHKRELVSRTLVWGDALGLYRHFCKSARNDEAQPEWREKASALGAELSCVLSSHPELFYQHCFAPTMQFTLCRAQSLKLDEDWSLWILPREHMEPPQHSRNALHGVRQQLMDWTKWIPAEHTGIRYHKPCSLFISLLFVPLSLSV